MKLAQLKRILIPEKIKTPQRLEEILQAEHAPIKIFGISFSPKYKLDQDVFDNAIGDKKELSIPQKLFLKLTGIGNPFLKLNINEGAIFRAPKASFGDTVTKARETIVQSVHNLVSSAGITKVETVEGDSFAAKESTQIIGTINGDNVGTGSAHQKIKTVKGHNSSSSKAQQSIKIVGGNSDSFGTSTQKIGILEGIAKIHGDSTIRVLSNERPPDILPF